MVKVIYPPLVEQSYRFMKSQGFNVSKDEVYKRMVSDKMIDTLGNPTQPALNKGLVSAFNHEHISLLDFKKEFQVFKSYPAREFCVVGKVWYISTDVADDIHERLERNSMTVDEINQVSTYYNMRNYENPKTVAEYKAVHFPMYEKYDDHHFHVKDGQILIDTVIVRDLANRTINGDIQGDVEAAYSILEQLESM